jgi:hypothetical protein
MISASLPEPAHAPTGNSSVNPQTARLFGVSKDDAVRLVSDIDS